MGTTRRQFLSAAAAATALPAGATQTSDDLGNLEAIVVKRHDEGVERLLAGQVMDPSSPYFGAYPDATDLHHPGTAAGLIDSFTAAFHHRASKYFRDPLMLERIRAAAAFYTRSMTAEGNIHLLISNFNSPPDTAFATLNLATAQHIAKENGTREIEQILRPILARCADALVVGGVHTPNHRWVVCAALAQIHALYPEARLVRRIDQWLAEGIDIDEDGQFDERSTLVYNPVTTRAFVTMAAKLKRPQLLEPVRRNLMSAIYLMHPDGEMVTEISRRQDRNQRGEIGVYWKPAHYLAYHDQNGLFASLAARYAPRYADLSSLMEYPELLKPLPALAPLPENYEKLMPALQLVRIRRGENSALILLRGDSRFFHFRRGGAVVQAVRLASAFFGKAQFIPQTFARSSDSWVLRQSLSAPYFQPLDPPHRVQAGEWDEFRPDRARTQVMHLEQVATITETAKGFRLRLQVFGTSGVPVAVEVNIRGGEGLELDGLLRAPGADDAFLLPAGFATVKSPSGTIRFGPGARAHRYTQVRGAEPKMPGASVYVTGYSPFDHTLEFEAS
ncbi:MAG: hypothetical protein NZV14_07030 [Bryobacteraceae bacterium]|nr:hypothetical protein [Bryobacteraceae bacterium]MDW8377896.1 hypothetical protein [Bryobacterales bacterium]